MIERYRELFINRPDAYAKQSQDGTEYWCIREPVTDQVIQWHLEGNETCGWYCLNAEGKVKWGVVDLDEEEEGIYTAQVIHKRLADLGVPAYIEESREGRAHLWVLTPPWPARPLRALLHSVVESKAVEVFPKQDRVGRGGLGSLVRGPLGLHRKTYAFYPFLDPETLERIPDSWAYVAEEMAPAAGWRLKAALNELLSANQLALPKAPTRGSVRTADTLAVAQALRIPLDRHAHYLQGICPLHPDEQHPSFTIYPESNIWICWHEHKMGQGGVSLYAAVKHISPQRAGEILKDLLA